MSHLRWLLLAAFLPALCLSLLFRDHLTSLFSHILEIISGSGVAGVALFIGLYVITCLLLLPGFILTYGAGVIFGLKLGIIAVSLGVTLGAAASFLAGRYLLRDWVETRAQHLEKLEGLKQATRMRGWMVVLLARLCPVVPFRISNYVFALTEVPFINFVLATFVGTLPGVCLYVHLGTLIGELGRVRGLHNLSAEEYQAYVRGVVGLVVLFLVALLLTRLATKRLEEISA